MTADASSISVVVLSYSRPRYLAQALASIAAQAPRPTEVIIVDNCSAASEEIAAISARHPDFTLIRNPVNSGFAGGMNLGVSRARGDYVFITEDDVVLEPGCLAVFLDRARDGRVPTILSGIMIDAERGTVLSAGGVIRLERVYRQEILHRGERDDPSRSPEPYDVEYIPGAMIFAPREAWSSLGGFREDFFVYGEDAEFCFRARLAGYRIGIVPSARVRHLPAPGAPPDFVEYHKLKNFLALYLLHAPVWVWPEFLARYVFLWLLRPSSRGRRRLMLRAVWWNVRRLARLLLDRGRVRPRAANAT